MSWGLVGYSELNPPEQGRAGWGMWAGNVVMGSGKAVGDSIVGRPASDQDRGSVAPLVLGMTVCLLLLGAGITAAGSAFLARQNLTGMCDGAAAAAANAVTSVETADGQARTPEQVANDYLKMRSPAAIALVTATPTSVTVNCHEMVSVIFGDLFGAGALDISVSSVGQVLYELQP